MDHIHRKNELKRKLGATLGSSSTGPELEPVVKQEVRDSVVKEPERAQTLGKPLKSHKKHRPTVRIRQRLAVMKQNPNGMTHMRTLVYSNAFRDVTDDLDVLLVILSDLKPWGDLSLPPADQLLHWSGDSFFHDQNGHAPDVKKANFHLHPSDPPTSENSNNSTHNDSTSNMGYPPTFSFTDSSNSSIPRNNTMLSPTTHSNIHRPRPTGLPLPHALLNPTKFKIQTVPDRLQNKMLARTLEKFRSGSFDLKLVNNDDIDMMYRPVWNDASQHMFWLSVFHQAAMLSLYFTFFIDKSVNILIRASDAVVNGDVEFMLASLPSTVQLSSDNASPAGPTLSPRYNPGAFFYNQEDLNRLTGKSYGTYGRLIRELRESINHYHHEYPAKMSLFSAWGCFMSVSSDVKTLCLMLQGTVVLIRKVLMESTTMTDVSIALRQEMMMVNALVLAMVQPDYLFDVIVDMVENFLTYRSVVNELIINYENGFAIYDSSLTAVLRDPLFRHDMHEFDKFLHKLTNVYYPLIRDMNSHYRGGATDHNLHFVSPTLLYNMMYEWFKVYPGEKMWVGLRLHPLKKALYLFFHALGNCLVHVFTPIKSVMIVDANNVLATKIGFKTEGAEHLTRPEYVAVTPVIMGLVKTIKFFEYRLMLYGYYMARASALDGEYISSPQQPAPANWEYQDVVQLMPEKLQVDETQLGSVSKNTLTAANVPLFAVMRTDATCARLIAEEIQRQYSAMQNDPWEFNYASGMLNHDFNPHGVVQYFVNVQTHAIMAGPLPVLDVMRARSERFLQGRIVVTNAVTN